MLSGENGGGVEAVQLVRLEPGDEDELDEFLTAHADGSMFLRSNLRREGLSRTGRRLQGVYVAGRDERGRMIGVVAHYGNGMIALMAPDSAGPLAARAAAESGRNVAGLVGPWDQVGAARAALAMIDRPTRMESREDLFALALDQLRAPPALAEGRLVCRVPRDHELAVAAAWSVDYAVEALGDPRTPELEAACAEQTRRGQSAGELWLLFEGAGPVAMTALNASVPDAVQVGGVYTPPDLRGRGYARAAVAGQLLDCRARGARRAVLFTGHDHHAARRAYQAIGFTRVGDYGIVRFSP